MSPAIESGTVIRSRLSAQNRWQGSKKATRSATSEIKGGKPVDPVGDSGVLSVTAKNPKLDPKTESRETFSIE